MSMRRFVNPPNNQLERTRKRGSSVQSLNAKEAWRFYRVKVPTW